MDGSVKQEEMAEHFKREVKENTRRRRAAEPTVLAERLLDDKHARAIPNPGAVCSRSSKVGVAVSSPRVPADTTLIMLYLEHLFPFLFPFYRPLLAKGGKAWMLDLMLSSSVVRHATLCQSSYFFSLLRGTANRAGDSQSVLEQTVDAFGVLREALQLIDGSDITEHFHGAVRVLTSIMQVQRFELAMLSFKNCQAHLSAAVSLFEQLLDNSSANSNFNGVMDCLGPNSYEHIPSPEQAAFGFSSALLVLDDIIASTARQEQPRLWRHHKNLLGDNDGRGAQLQLEDVVGCQNWTLLRISETAALDAWKQQCTKAGNLDVMLLVQKAETIKTSLQYHLALLEDDATITPNIGGNLLDSISPELEKIAGQKPLISRIWAHAALLYLSVVVSGWQPASIDVRCHVDRVVELLTQVSPPSLLRTATWPLCLSGCLAEPVHQIRLRSTIKALQPPSVFGTAHRALEIMEEAWCNDHFAGRNVATCFQRHGELVLLV